LPCPFVEESVQRCGPHLVQAPQLTWSTRWPGRLLPGQPPPPPPPWWSCACI